MSWSTESSQGDKAWQKAKSARFSQLMWGILIILAVLFIAYKTIIDWHKLKDTLWRLNWHNFLIGFGVYSVSIILTASCWALIMGYISGVRTFWKHVSTFCLTNLAQRLPTPLPYISARAEAYAIQGISRRITLVAMSIEITVTLFSAVLVALMTFLVSSFTYAYVGIVKPFLYVLLLALSIPILFPQKFFNSILVRLNSPFSLELLSKERILIWVGIFVIIWLNSGVLYYYLINSVFPIPKELLLFLTNVSAVSGIAGWFGQIFFFMPTFAIRQLTMVYLLSFYFPMPLAIIFTLFIRICVMVFEVIWASIFFIIIRIKQVYFSN